MNDLDLTELERSILDQSNNPSATRRRMIAVALVGLLAVVATIAAARAGVSRSAMGWITVAYICLSVLEKLAYGRAVLGYKSVIQKLVRRVAQLNGDRA